MPRRTPTQRLRVARNETAFRRASELQKPNALIPFACECGEAACSATVALSVDEYVFARRWSGYLAVTPAHAPRDAHVVVAEAERFAVVG